MNILDRIIAGVSPQRGLARVRARAAIMHYDAATTGRRGSSFHAARGDADAVAGFGRRERMAAIARDMVRNTPFAARAQQVIAANVVGDGIVPKIITPKGLDATRAADFKRQGLALIEAHLDTTAIDADGRQNLYGLQTLVMNTVVDAGEALIVRKVQPLSAGNALPIKLQVLEPDHLDRTRDGWFRDGSSVHEGIQYGADGQREGYWLYEHHPGAAGGLGGVIGQTSIFVPVADVLHIFRQDRPGQMRGVSWFAPIAIAMQDLGDYQDAQIMRQKIAATFAGFRKLSDGGAGQTDIGETLSPGLIQDIGPEEEMIFTDPPTVGDFDPFTASVLRSIAAGMGITYEALTGDLSRVNFSSARMGRMEMDRNVSSWQWKMMIPLMMQPLGRWLLEAWIMADPAVYKLIAASRLDWVPPHRMLVDPAREISALKDAVRAGFNSRQSVVRSFGIDPERLTEEQIEDRATADDAGLVFDSDARNVSSSGVAHSVPPVGDTPITETET